MAVVEELRRIGRVSASVNWGFDTASGTYVVRHGRAKGSRGSEEKN